MLDHIHNNSESKNLISPKKKKPLDFAFKKDLMKSLKDGFTKMVNDLKSKKIKPMRVSMVETDNDNPDHGNSQEIAIPKNQEEPAKKIVPVYQTYNSKLAKKVIIKNLVKFIGALILLLDIMAKISYYNFSRFASNQLKQLFLSFLYLRPILVIALVSYNLLVSMKNLCHKVRREKRRFKDDI